MPRFRIELLFKAISQLSTGSIQETAIVQNFKTNLTSSQIKNNSLNFLSPLTVM